MLDVSSVREMLFIKYNTHMSDEIINTTPIAEVTETTEETPVVAVPDAVPEVPATQEHPAEMPITEETPVAPVAPESAL